MGTLVTVIKSGDTTKPQYEVLVVLAASVTVDTTELVVWIGDDFSFSQLETYNAILRCLERIREGGTPPPLTTNVSGAEAADPSKSAVRLITDATLAVLEAEVAVYYGSAFQKGVGTSVTAHTRRALELYLESTAKAA